MIFLNEQDISGEAYAGLIRYAVETTDAFMFVVCNYYHSRPYREAIQNIRQALDGLCIKKRSNPIWPSTEVDPSTKHHYRIEMYRCEEKAIPVLLRPGSCFSWVYPDYPEDLSFFRNGRCWMSITAHEEFIIFHHPTQQDILFLSSIVSLAQEDTCLPESDDFLENYDLSGKQYYRDRE